MKKLFPLLLLFTGLITACEKGSENELEAERHTVAFSVKDYTVSQTDFNKQTSRIQADSLRNVADYLSCRIYDASSGLLVGSVDQTKASNISGFGRISLDLPRGNYKAVFVASKAGIGWQGGTGANFSNDYFYGATPPNDSRFTTHDTFYKKLDLTVNSDSSVDVVLNRIVAGLDIILEDGLPADATTVEITVQGDANTYHIATDLKTGALNRSNYLVVLNSPKGVANTVLSSLVFKEGAYDIKIRVNGSFGAVLAEKIIRNVPFSINKKTTLRGRLINPMSSVGFTVLLDTEWDAPPPVVTF